MLFILDSLPTRVSKKKMNLNKPFGTRVVFDDEGNAQAPLAALAVKDDTLCEINAQMALKGMFSSTYYLFGIF